VLFRSEIGVVHASSGSGCQFRNKFTKHLSREFAGKLLESNDLLARREDGVNSYDFGASLLRVARGPLRSLTTQELMRRNWWLAVLKGASLWSISILVLVALWLIFSFRELDTRKSQLARQYENGASQEELVGELSKMLKDLEGSKPESNKVGKTLLAIESLRNTVKKPLVLDHFNSEAGGKISLSGSSASSESVFEFVESLNESAVWQDVSVVQLNIARREDGGKVSFVVHGRVE